MRLTLLGMGAMASVRHRPAGLLVSAGGARVMLDGGPGSAPEGPLDAWLVCDDSSELQSDLRRLAEHVGCRPVVGRFVGGGLSIEPRPVEHTSHATFGYEIEDGERRVVWAPEFLRFPDWATGADLMFAEAAGWARPIRFAHGAGGHAAAVDVAEAARAAGVRRLVLAHLGRPTLRALDRGARPSFGEVGVEGRTYVPRRRDRGAAPVARRVGHEALPHTADAGIRAWAPNIEALFAEAARALSELAADVAVGAPGGTAEGVTVEAADLAALAFGWLNELVALGDARAAAIGAVRSIRVAPPEPAEPAMGWRLAAEVELIPIDGRLVRRRLEVKSATYHGLSVTGRDGRWTLQAYVDV